VEIKIEDYIVITISSAKDAECAFLVTVGRKDSESWYYAAMGPGCENKTISKPTYNDTSNEQKCYSFYLINAEYWKCENNDHRYNCNCTNKKPSNEINSLLERIKNCKRKIIIWTHKSDNIFRDAIESSLEKQSNIYDSFSHSHENSIVEQFMFKVCKTSQDNFEQEFKKLIESSLKNLLTPHLIALSILCQGYLAANKEYLNDEERIIKLPEGISIPKGKKENTRRREWWEPALGKECKGNELNKELETVDADKDKKHDIVCLMKIIRDEKVKNDDNEIVYFEKGKLESKEDDSKINEFTEKVNKAYGQLTKILGATK